jgi:hypothetical protein
LENRRILYDSAALGLAVLPLVVFFFWFLTLATAPAAIILAIYSWRKPNSILPRTRIRSWLAIVIAALQIAGWVVLFIAISSNASWR